MSRRCELTDKGPQFGNRRSHAENKTRRCFLPNLQRIDLWSDTLKYSVRMKISMSALRNIERAGGLDSYLEKRKDRDLPMKALHIKRKIDRAKLMKPTASS